VTYQLVETVADGKSYAGITCLLCGRTSYNLNDIANRYCGACHRFHEDHVPESHPMSQALGFYVLIPDDTGWSCVAFEHPRALVQWLTRMAPRLPRRIELRVGTVSRGTSDTSDLSGCRTDRSVGP
jgi:hypothetical protein